MNLCAIAREASVALFMKTLIRLFVLAWLALSPLTSRAATLVAQYFPMNDGDIRYFSGVGGESYLEFIEEGFGEPARFSMEIYQKKPRDVDYDHFGRSTYGYSDAGDILINYGQKGPIGAYLYFQPP